MKKFLAENKKAYAQYQLNKKMISFKYIPKEFRKKVYKKIKKIIL